MHKFFRYRWIYLRCNPISLCIYRLPVPKSTLSQPVISPNKAVPCRRRPNRGSQFSDASADFFVAICIWAAPYKRLYTTNAVDKIIVEIGCLSTKYLEYYHPKIYPMEKPNENIIVEIGYCYCLIRLFIKFITRTPVIKKHFRLPSNHQSNKATSTTTLLQCVPLVSTHNPRKYLHYKVWSWMCVCLVAWCYYQLIAKPANKTTAPPWTVKEITKSSSTFSATNISSNIVWSFSLHDTIQRKSHFWYQI